MTKLAFDWRWGVPALLLFMYISLNPVGFAGGQSDDARYVEAALCWVRNGACLPDNHWSGRWPVVLPLSASISLFGLSRYSVGLISLLFSGGCLFLLKIIADRLTGRGLQAALIFAATPPFAVALFRPAAEPIELFFALSCFACALWRKPLLAGLALGLAFQTRETSAALIPLLAWLLWRTDKRGLPWALTGFLSPLAIELITYFTLTGDPVFRRKLSVAHTLIPSTELTGTVSSGLPFLNVHNIANWHHSPGLKVHWFIDGALNLLVNPGTGLVFLFAPVLVAIYKVRHGPALILASAFVTIVLIYVFAIDPKPRMFMVPLAMCSIALAALPFAPAVVASYGVMLAASVYSVMGEERASKWEAYAREWDMQYPGQINMENWLRNRFMLEPRLRNLRGNELLLTVVRGDCRIWADQERLVLVREQRLNHPTKPRICLTRPGKVAAAR